ncbi:MAG: FecR domain-containing protein [Myxococcota bacterium]
MKAERRKRSRGSIWAPIVAGLAIALAVAALAPLRATAEGIGLVKTTSGEVVIERGDERLVAAVGMPVYQKDRIVTGRDGSIGLTLADNAMLSAGPDSVLALETFRFDPGTHAGQLEVSLESGTLSAIAGKMVEANPESMKVRTPAAVLGVRGTEFAVRVEETAFARFWKSLRFGTTGGGRAGMDPGTAGSGSTE